MNREERRKLYKDTKKAQIVEEDLNEQGKDFLQFAEEQNVNLNAFFKMVSVWFNLSIGQKEAIICEGIKRGKIDLEDKGC